MATDQRASSSPLLLLLLSLLIGAAAALASRHRWPFQCCFSSHRCCFSLSGLCFLIHCENNDSLHSSCWPFGLGFGYMSAEGNNILPSVSLVFSSMLIIAGCFTYAFARQLNAFQTGDMLFGMWNSYILWNFAWCFSTVGYPGHSAVEKRLLYDSIIIDEHFKDKDVHATGNLLHIAIFNISYIRGLFPEKYFNEKSVPALRCL
ncbi:uncharacterized protein LOC114271751 isoform X2 [Camellia sinensis]|uniref:uncharacterized protein LOC114271751 isoform X2 n=1 Tax=Camellia sinensis TaxID=4442 RepID=UPI001036C275|nr:uncharacterized protein LOC114271751 isoform X2 [Camellia sinensis]XP_028069180.1 uncharacterized protein LOC114271751 isoform X2 [Camellia sinensis]